MGERAGLRRGATDNAATGAMFSLIRNFLKFRASLLATAASVRAANPFLRGDNLISYPATTFQCGPDGNSCDIEHNDTYMTGSEPGDPFTGHSNPPTVIPTSHGLK